MNLEYSVTERIRLFNGRIVEIEYEFEELMIERSSTETSNRQERRTLTYQTHVTRNNYNEYRENQEQALIFDDFISILRPFLFGYYQGEQLKEAFALLEHDEHIRLEQLEDVLLVLDSTFTIERLKLYLQTNQIDIDNDTLNYQQFRTIILKGIGRDVICHHI